MTVHITIEGNLIGDPRPGQLPDGTPTANFTVACNTSKKNQAGEWEESGSQLFGVSGYRGHAEGVLNSLRKGSPVVVSGRLKFRKFTTKDGVEVTALEIDADSIAYSIRFHDVQGGRRQAGGGGAAGGAAASYYGQPQQQAQQPAQSPWGQQAAAQPAWGQPAVQQPPQQQGWPQAQAAQQYAQHGPPTTNAAQQAFGTGFDDEQPF